MGFGTRAPFLVCHPLVACAGREGGGFSVPFTLRSQQQHAAPLLPVLLGLSLLGASERPCLRPAGLPEVPLVMLGNVCGARLLLAVVRFSSWIVLWGPSWDWVLCAVSSQVRTVGEQGLGLPARRGQSGGFSCLHALSLEQGWGQVGAVWAAPSVKSPPLGFRSGRDLRAVGSSPVRLRAESLRGRLETLSLPPLLLLLLSFSLSRK